MAEMVYFRTIADINRDAWNKCFPDEAQSFDAFMRAENMRASAFTNRYYCLMEGTEMICAVPAFCTAYSLPAIVTSRFWKWLIEKCMKDHILTLACLGMPDSASCVTGFAPGVPQERREALVAQMTRFFQESAFGEGFKVLAVKQLCVGEQECGKVFADAGFDMAAGIYFKARWALAGYLFRRALIEKTVLL